MMFVHDGDTKNADVNVENVFLKLLMIPSTIGFFDFDTITSLQCICKPLAECIANTPESIAFWQSMCTSLSQKSGLYTYACYVPFFNARKHFFDQLWPARRKWVCEEDANLQAFKVRVVCRFRPGEHEESKLFLPLHQFLRVRRMHVHDKDAKAKVFVGKVDPPEFVDPFLGTLMKDPVKLLSSGHIVERNVAIHCAVRKGRDPFNNARLTPNMIEPQPELKERICAWRRSKDESKQDDISLSMDDVKPLVNQAAVDPELLQALVDSERLEQAAERAELDALESERSEREDHDADPDTSNPEVAVNGDGTDQIPGGMENVMDIANQTGEFVPENPTEEPVTMFHELPTEMSNTDIQRAKGWGKNGPSAKVLQVDEKHSFVSMHMNGVGIKPFHFAKAHSGEASQQDVYETSVRDSVVASLNGFNATVLCYGQTGSGKTYTFFGPDGALEHDITGRVGITECSGVVVRSLAEIFEARDRLQYRGINLVITLQFVEIYNEEVTDLLTGDLGDVRRDTGELTGVAECGVGDMVSAMDVLRKGHARKRFGSTDMNERSSRSHTSLVVKLAQTQPEQGTKLISSQLVLLDLAGSERVKKSRVDGGRLREAVGINSSLLVLGKVISALVKSRSHVPYLESKLTIMLKGAFGGNSLTTAIVNCRPETGHGEETLQSLRFGERCSMVSNTAVQAAGSVTHALEAITNALEMVESQLTGLRARNKTHLPSYKKLAASCQTLQRQKRDLEEKLM